MTGSKDYPTSQQQYNDTLRTETGCRAYLTRLRWPKGFLCPKCNSKGWLSKRGLYVCSAKSCQRQTSLTAGTQLEGLSVPLHEWFEIMWGMAWQRRATTVTDARVSLARRKPAAKSDRTTTAWRCLRRLQQVMAELEERPLEWTVEIGDTVVSTRGGRRHSVLIAAERRGRYKTGRIKLALVPTLTTDQLQAFVRKSVRPPTQVLRTAWDEVTGLAELGYALDACGAKELARVSRVSADLQEWFRSDRRGAVRAENLDYYLAEFAFLWNGRRNWNPGKTFYSLLKAAVTPSPPSAGVARIVVEKQCADRLEGYLSR